jgi:hypothetical protein
MKIANVSGRLALVSDEGGVDVAAASNGRFGIGATRQPPQFLRPGQVLSSYLDGVGTMASRLVAPPR